MTNKNYCDCRQGRDPCTCKAADPVPPAGGEPEVLLDQLDDYIARINGEDRGSDGTVNQLRAHVTRLQAELKTAIEACDAYGVQVVEQRAEEERLKSGPPHFCGLPMSLNPHVDAGVPGRFLEVGAVRECIPCLVKSRHDWATKAGALQSDLTKALELLQNCTDCVRNGEDFDLPVTTMASIDAFRSNQSAPADKGESVASAVFNDPLYNAESDARNASAMLEEVIELFDDGVGRSTAEFKLMRKIGDWLGRSVPRIDGGSDECAHSEANKIGCPECGEVFK